MSRAAGRIVGSGSGSQAFQLRENVLGVASGRHAAPDAAHDSRGIDEEAHPASETEEPPDPVRAQNVALRIAQHRERQGVALDESRLRPEPVRADADDAGALRLEPWKRLAEPAGLERSTRRRGLGKEEQRQPAAPEVLERHAGAPRGGQLERRRRLADSGRLVHGSSSARMRLSHTVRVRRIVVAGSVAPVGRPELAAGAASGRRRPASARP